MPLLKLSPVDGVWKPTLQTSVRFFMILMLEFKSHTFKLICYIHIYIYNIYIFFLLPRAGVYMFIVHKTSEILSVWNLYRQNLFWKELKNMDHLILLKYSLMEIKVCIWCKPDFVFVQHDVFRQMYLYFKIAHYAII